MKSLHWWLTSCLLGLCITLQAQIIGKPFFGFNRSHILGRYDDTKLLDKSDETYGYNIGVLLEFPTRGNWIIESGAYFSRKGYHLLEIKQNVLSDIHSKTLYLVSPIYMRREFDIHRNDGKVYFRMGGYVGVGIGGTLKGEFDISPLLLLSPEALTLVLLGVDPGFPTNIPSDFDEDIQWGKGGNYGRFDSGFALGIGYYEKTLEFGLNLERSILNIAPDDRYVYSMKNVVVSFHLAFRIEE